MTPFKHVLVPTDFGESADRALALAIDIASQSGAKITLIHVWFVPAAYSAYGQGVYWPSDDIERAAKATLEKALAKAKELYPKTESALVFGQPWRAILALATERDVDLIVMGTHGRRGLSRLFLGSVAEKVVRLSPVPVLTVSTEAERKAKALALAQGADAMEKVTHAHSTRLDDEDTRSDHAPYDSAGGGRNLTDAGRAPPAPSGRAGSARRDAQ